MNRTVAAAVLLAASAPPVLAQAQLEPPVRVMAFGDASFLWTERDVDGGFSIGQLVSHLSAGLSERLTVTVEATVTPRSTATVATLERLIVRYDVGDGLKLSAGRYHTPIAWWNTQYHHGLWLQTSVDRPQLVRFGTPLIPVHFTGILAEGTLPLGPATVIYEAGVGNGRQPDLVAPGDAGDANGSAAVVGGLRFRPSLVTGLELGVHAYADEVDAGAGPVDERIVGGHVAWGPNPEVVVEYLHFIHDPEATGAATTDADGAYAQAAWRIPAARSLQPYLRWETIQIDAADPLFAGLGLAYDGIIAGVRWDFADFAALKGEVRSEELAGGERLVSAVLNASFVIPNIIQ